LGGVRTIWCSKRATEHRGIAPFCYGIFAINRKARRRGFKRDSDLLAGSEARDLDRLHDEFASLLVAFKLRRKAAS